MIKSPCRVLVSKAESVYLGTINPKIDMCNSSSIIILVLVIVTILGRC